MKYYINLVLYKFKKLFLISPEDEAAFYENFFTKNPKWNTLEGNEDELSRWNVIDKYLHSIIGANEFKSGGYKILDLGCGRGWLSNLLKAYGNVTAIEPVEAVIEFAKKSYKDIEFIAGRGADLLASGYSNHFDIIASSEVIEHVPNNQKLNFLKEAHSLLRSEGYLIITTPRKEALNEWKAKFGSSPGQPIEEWSSQEELTSLLTSAGFKIFLNENLYSKTLRSNESIELYQTYLAQK